MSFIIHFVGSLFRPLLAKGREKNYKLHPENDNNDNKQDGLKTSRVLVQCVIFVKFTAQNLSYKKQIIINHYFLHLVIFCNKKILSTKSICIFIK